MIVAALMLAVLLLFCAWYGWAEDRYTVLHERDSKPLGDPPVKWPNKTQERNEQ